MVFMKKYTQVFLSFTEGKFNHQQCSDIQSITHKHADLYRKSMLKTGTGNK